MDYKERIISILTNNELTLEQKKQLEKIFPELKESEDEKIRKALIRYFTLSDEHAYNEACGVSYRDIVAWLEKQGEQKEIDYNEELKKCKDNPLYFFDKYVKVKLKERKFVWGEKDEKNYQMLQNIICDSGASAYLVNKLSDWLKSLKQKLKGE